MESIGDEKRIRALFSEVRFAGEQTAPSFTSMWQRAQSRAMKPRRAFNLSFVAATALLIFALASLAVWSRYSRPNEKMNAAFANVPAPSNFTPAVIKTGSEAAPPDAPVKMMAVRSRPIKLAGQRRTSLIAENRKAEKEAKQIASWQSPTASLLSSSSDELFKSLPQLNENASEMKSFLPNRSNDKEK